MSKTNCVICLDAKATLACKVCADPICKKCAHVVEEDRMPYLDDQVPAPLKGGGVFCNQCFEEKVEPQLSEYDSTLEKAKDVFVFFDKEGKETRLIRRSEKTFKVIGDDKEDIVLKLAFLAARAGYNAVVDISIESEKRREGSYKLMTWRGSGTAANVDAARHNR